MIPDKRIIEIFEKKHYFIVRINRIDTLFRIIVLLILFQFIASCSYSVPKDNITFVQSTVQAKPIEQDTIANILIKRFNPPQGYDIIQSDSNSFAYYLQHLPLKNHGSPVHLYNGKIKPSYGIYCAVVDYSLGNRDLQQCADAVMRLRAEYLYRQHAFDDIHFNFVSDGKPRYYSDYAKGDTSYSVFLNYLDYIFSYANTRSLYNELKPVDSINKMKIGDVFIQRGNPYGHAIIVINMAYEIDTGNKLFMLAQSYMPAQDIQILINRENPENSPWYTLKEGTVQTPEWTFYSSDLHRFPE